MAETKAGPSGEGDVHHHGEPDAEPSGLDPRPTRMLDGRLLLRQMRAGHRAGTDAVLLAAAARPEPGSVIVDVGSGVGIVGLCLALREATATVRLVEAEPELAAAARENVALNGLGGRVAVAEMNIFDRERRRSLDGAAALVVSNPPFFRAGTTRLAPHPLRARAHVLTGHGESAPGHGDWLRAMLAMSRPHGTVMLIHRPEALPALLAAAEGRLGGVCLRAIHARAGGPAIRILFGGIVGSRAPLVIADPLVLHGDDGKFTPVAEALHRGEATHPLIARRTGVSPQKSRPNGPAS